MILIFHMMILIFLRWSLSFVHFEEVNLILFTMILIFEEVILILFTMILIFDLDQKIYDLLQLCRAQHAASRLFRVHSPASESRSISCKYFSEVESLSIHQIHLKKLRNWWRLTAFAIKVTTRR